MRDTIGQRWAIHRRTSKHDINHHMEDVVVEFAEQERALQRQECALGLEKWWKEGNAQGAGDWIDNAKRAILTAGVEPQGPFGCTCWRVTDDGQWWRNEPDGGATFLNDDAKYCDMCGKAKRRET